MAELLQGWDRILKMFKHLSTLQNGKWLKLPKGLDMVAFFQGWGCKYSRYKDSHTFPPFTNGKWPDCQKIKIWFNSFKGEAENTQDVQTPFLLSQTEKDKIARKSSISGWNNQDLIKHLSTRYKLKWPELPKGIDLVELLQGWRNRFHPLQSENDRNWQKFQILLHCFKLMQQ